MQAETNKYSSSSLTLLALAMLIALTACPDSSQSGSSAQSQGAGTAQATAPSEQTQTKLKRSIARELPLDSTFTIESVAEQQGGAVEITAVSAWDTLRTSTYILDSLAKLGYETGDNASRILEGTVYTKPNGKIAEIDIRITLEKDDSCRVMIEAKPRSSQTL
jgi:hypothetical protein